MEVFHAFKILQMVLNCAKRLIFIFILPFTYNKFATMM